MPRYIGFDPSATFSASTSSEAVMPTVVDTSLTTLYLPFDTDVNDDSTSAVSVTTNGSAAVQTSTTKYGAGALSLGGSGDYLTMPAGTFPNGEATWTIEGWANHNNSSDHELIGDGNNNRSLIIFRRDGNKLYVAAHDSAGSVEIYPSNNVATHSQWYHWALVLDNGELSLYAGGNRIGTGSFSGSGVLRSAVDPVYIGRRPGSSYDMNGYLDDIRITKAALYSGSTYTVPTSATGLHSVTNRPVSFYTTFDSDLNDEAGNTLTGTASGSAARSTATKIFGAASLYIPSRSGDYVTYDDSAEPVSFEGDYTIEAFVQLSDITSANNYIWSKRENSSTHANSAWAFKWMGSSNAWEIYQAQGSSQHVTSHSDTISTGVWYHIAVVRSGTNLLLFRDGTLISGTNTTGAGGALNTPSTNIVLGDLAGGSSNGFAGYIDDFRISNIARYTKNFIPPSQAVGVTLNGTNETNSAGGSSETVNDLAVLYLPFDDSSFADQARGHSVSAAGTAQLSTSVKQFGSSSLLLDGNSDYLTISNNADFQFGSNNFTIEAWVYQTAAAGSAAADRHPIIARMASSSNRSFHLGIVESSGAQALQFSFTTDGSTAVQYEFGGDVTINTWHFISLVRNSGTITCYLNGTALSTTGNIGTSSIYVGTSDLTIGYRGLSSQYFQGYIDDVKVIKNFALRTGNFSVPTTAAGSEVSVTTTTTKSHSSVFSLNSQNAEAVAGTWPTS